MSEATSAPLRENEHVKELLSILQANSAGEAKNFLDMLRYVGAMERQLDTAVKELTVMRRELGEIRETQNHPVRTALQNAVAALETKVNAAWERLDAIKQSVVEGCKNTVSAFKEKGIAALNGLMDFFKVKDSLLDIREGMNDAIRSAEKSINRIEAVSTEYHEIGKHMKNIARAFTGKEAAMEAKPVGKLAKAAQAPHQFRKSIVSGVAKGVDAAIGKVNRLEQAAAEKKPSLLENLQAMTEQAARTKQDVPAPDRPKTKETSL